MTLTRMPATVEVDEQNCGKDADHPLALRVKLGGTLSGYPQGMEFIISYRLRIEGGEQAKKVDGVCDVCEMRAVPTDDAEAGD